jgi:hypothetical protein
MSASPDAVTPMLRPPRPLRVLAASLRDAVAAARQAVRRMDGLIAAARLDHADD